MLRTGVRKFRYCCLGAACVVANETGFMKIDLEAEQGNSESLPIKLAKRLNITVSGSFKNYVEYKGKPYISLVDLNDDAKANFKDIARIIREHDRNQLFVAFTATPAPVTFTSMRPN